MPAVYANGDSRAAHKGHIRWMDGWMEYEDVNNARWWNVKCNEKIALRG